MSDIIKELKKHWIDEVLNGTSFASLVGYSNRYIEVMKAAEDRVRAAIDGASA